MKKNSAYSLSLIFCALLFVASNASAVLQSTNGAYYMGWQTISTSNNLPSNPICIAASTPTATNTSATGDFVAVASDTVGSAANFYFLDHANLALGWQKKGCFLQADVTGIAYGLGRFSVMGIDDTSKKPVVATSTDNGQTWSQKLIFGGTGHYDNAAFSDKLGVMTGKDGAIATTSDGNTWFETTAPSGIERKIFYKNVATDGAMPDYEFEIFATTPVSRYGFLSLNDAPITASPDSPDGTNWSYLVYFPAAASQILIYDQSMFFVYNTTYLSQPLSNLAAGVNGYQPLDANDSSLPLINVSNFVSYRGWLVAVGSNLKTGQNLSLFNPTLVNGNSIFSADFFPKPVSLVAGCQNGFVAVANDGTSYFASTAITQD